MNFSDVAVVMASKNEEDAISDIIIKIGQYCKNEAEIIVVDSSDDRTSVIAESLGAVVIRQKPQGYGVAVKTALLATNRDIIITIDCDGTYPIEKIPEFIGCIREGFDVVSGCRISSQLRDMPFLNMFGNTLFAQIASLLYGYPIHDVTTGMRAYRKKVIRGIEWEDNTGLSAELLIRPIRHGYRITEIQIPYYPRVGTTKLNPFTGGLSILKTIIKFRIFTNR